MKTRGWKRVDGGWPTRSVLECGSPLPLSGRRVIRGACQSARGLAHSKTWRSFVATLLLSSTLNFQLSTFAQSYSIDWHTIDNGGGTSTGGGYSLSGTIGQPDASQQTMTGGNYSLTGGFWALYAVQTLGAPTLTIVPASPGNATISWTPDTPGWVLQETLSLSPTNWVNSASGSANPIVVPVNGTTKFYRLNKP